MCVMKEKLAFELGWSQLQIKDVKAVRNELMEALNITTTQALRNRRTGKIDHTLSEKEVIEEIFHKRGIKKIWGTANLEE